MLVMWTIFFVMKLDGTVSWPFASILMIPLSAVIISAVLTIIDQREKPFFELLKIAGIFLWFGLILVLFMLNLGSKGALISWNIVFLPLYVTIIYLFLN